MMNLVVVIPGETRMPCLASEWISPSLKYSLVNDNQLNTWCYPGEPQPRWERGICSSQLMKMLRRSWVMRWRCWDASLHPVNSPRLEICLPPAQTSTQTNSEVWNTPGGCWRTWLSPPTTWWSCWCSWSSSPCRTTLASLLLQSRSPWNQPFPGESSDNLHQIPKYKWN